MGDGVPELRLLGEVPVRRLSDAVPAHLPQIPEAVERVGDVHKVPLHVQRDPLHSACGEPAGDAADVGILFRLGQGSV